jgi:leucyl/phenylalanyl-tRNA--protein transferase
MDVAEAIALYAAGWFPMDDDPGAPQIPWYAVEQRTIFELDAESRARLRRKVRRSLRPCAELTLVVDANFSEVLVRCASSPDGADGVWITPRLRRLYGALHETGAVHSFELCDENGALAAGIVAVVIGRAAMLESMRRVRSHAGNALLSRTLDLLAERGVELCDIQLPTDHTLRLGATQIPRADYERRLLAAVTAPGRRSSPGADQAW